MISTDLQTMADRLAGAAAAGCSIEPEVAGCMALALLDHARVVAVLESLPFELTRTIVAAIEVPSP